MIVNCDLGLDESNRALVPEERSSQATLMDYRLGFGAAFGKAVRNEPCRGTTLS
jgi:hypothetical protein